MEPGDHEEHRTPDDEHRCDGGVPRRPYEPDELEHEQRRHEVGQAGRHADQEGEARDMVIEQPVDREENQPASGPWLYTTPRSGGRRCRQGRSGAHPGRTRPRCPRRWCRTCGLRSAASESLRRRPGDHDQPQPPHAESGRNAFRPVHAASVREHPEGHAPHREGHVDIDRRGHRRGSEAPAPNRFRSTMRLSGALSDWHAHSVCNRAARKRRENTLRD